MNNKTFTKEGSFQSWNVWQSEEFHFQHNSKKEFYQ